MEQVAGRLCGRSVLRALARRPSHATRGPVTAAHVPDVGRGGPTRKVGYALGRRHGNAVQRNRLRRRLRAVVREVAADVPAGAYLLRARPSAAVLPHPRLRDAVREAMRAAAGAGTASGARGPDDARKEPSDG